MAFSNNSTNIQIILQKKNWNKAFVVLDRLKKVWRFLDQIWKRNKVFNLKTFLLASQSDAHRIAPHRDPIPTHPIQSNPTYSSKARKTHEVIYFWKGNRTRTLKTMFPRVWHPNTQIQIHKCTQIHKYTNTVLVKLWDRPNMWYIFEKVMVQGLQKKCSQVKTKKT